MCGGMGCGCRGCLSFVSPKAKVLCPPPLRPHHTHYLILLLGQIGALIQREATSPHSQPTHSLV